MLVLKLGVAIGEILSGTAPDRDAESEEAILENIKDVPRKDITPSVDIITKGIDTTCWMTVLLTTVF